MTKHIITLLFKEYMDYLSVIFRRILRRDIKKPWMKYREIQVITEVLTNFKPKKCLEWGSGYSTLFFPQLLSNNFTWISIEHDKNWFEIISRLNRNKNVKIFHVPPNKYPWSDDYKDGSYDDLRDYIEFPTRFGKFDFILIDGRARRECLKKSYNILIKNGIVILHDANRVYYHDSFKFFKYTLLLKDYRTDAGGIWIGSKGLKIENVLDVEKWSKYWKIINKFGKILRI